MGGMQPNETTTHRWVQPVMNQTTPCECSLCIRHDEMMLDYEALVTSPIAPLINEGWMPREIVAAVTASVPKSSRAPMLTRVALVSQVDLFFGETGFSGHVAQIRQLASRTGFTAGLTDPGWFERWYWNKGKGNTRLAARTVLYIRQALDPILLLLPLIGDDPTSSLWTTPSGRTHSPMGGRVPEPGDQRWRL